MRLIKRYVVAEVPRSTDSDLPQYRNASNGHRSLLGFMAGKSIIHGWAVSQRSRFSRISAAASSIVFTH